MKNALLRKFSGKFMKPLLEGQKNLKTKSCLHINMSIKKYAFQGLKKGTLKLICNSENSLIIWLCCIGQ